MNDQDCFICLIQRFFIINVMKHFGLTSNKFSGLAQRYGYIISKPNFNKNKKLCYFWKKVCSATYTAT